MADNAPISFGGPTEYYSDAVRLSVNAFGFIFSFGLQTENPGESSTQATVRMSPQHALVFFQVLKNNLRAYEASVGKIALPDAIYDEMKIEREV